MFWGPTFEKWNEICKRFICPFSLRYMNGHGLILKYETIHDLVELVTDILHP